MISSSPQRNPTPLAEVRRPGASIHRGTASLGVAIASLGFLIVATSALAQPSTDDRKPPDPAALPGEPGADDAAAPQDPGAPAGPAAPPAPKDDAVSPVASPAPPASPASEDGKLDQIAPADGAVEGEGEGEVIVITVDRREKDLQDYSGTASAFSASDLAAVGVGGVNDLSALVPGLQIGTQEGNTELYVRGVGSDNNTELGDPAVALHLDGVYIPRPRGAGMLFFDLERVEVNSGPQGTLRGRNALGGTVNILTAQPRLDLLQAYVEGEIGNYGSRVYRAMLNQPISKDLAVRIAAYSSSHDSYFENGGPIKSLKAGESADDYAVRLTTTWKPSSELSVTASYDYLREQGAGYTGANYQNLFTRTDDNGEPAPLDPNSLDRPRRVVYVGDQPFVDTYHHGGRLTASYKAGPVALELTGSVRGLRYQQQTGSNLGVAYPGYDGTTIPREDTDRRGTAFWDTKSTSYTGELRAYSADDARVRWTTGLFGAYEKQSTFLGTTSDPATFFGGIEFTMPNVKGSSVAGYADATADIIPQKLRVLGGARVTREFKSRKDGLAGIWGFDFDGGRFGTEGFRYRGLSRPAIDFSKDPRELFLEGIQTFGARDAVPAALCNAPMSPDGPTLNADLTCANGFRANFRQASVVKQDNEVTDSFFDWRVGVEYDLAYNNLLYSTISTGHKAGGFNDTLFAGDGQPLFNSTYDPESVIALEVGSKNILQQGKLRANFAGFAYKYTDQVFQSIVATAPNPNPADPNSSAPVAAVRRNVASTLMLGAQLDAGYQLPYSLTAAVNVLLLDARFDDGTLVNDSRLSFGINNYLVDIGGNQLPRASPLTANYGLSQRFETPVGRFEWVATAQTRLKHFMTVFNGAGKLLPPADPKQVPVGNADYDALVKNATRLDDSVPTYSRLDLGASWMHPGKKIELSAYVNNVLDTAHVSSIISTPGLNLRFFNSPRTMGLRLRVTW
jgi:iron complex outermembrane recepter protein